MPDPAPSLPLGEEVPDPTPRAAPSHRSLEGLAIALHPLDPDRDAQGLFLASHGDPHTELLWTYLPAGPFESVAALRDWYRSMSSGGDPLFYTVTDRASAEPVGVVSLLAIEPDHGTIEIGHIWYAPHRQRTSVNTEACHLLLREAFEGLNYRRVEWKCDGANQPSRVAALRLGFRFEGLFRQHRIVRGRNRDTAWFSILDSEWSAVDGAMRRWLEWDEALGPRPPLASLRSEPVTHG